MASAPPTFAEVFGAFVKALRGERDQTAFGKEAGLSQSAVSALETCSRPVRSVHVDKLLAANNVDVATMCLMMRMVAKELAAGGGGDFVDVSGGGEPAFVRRDEAAEVIREAAAGRARSAAPVARVAPRPRAAKQR